MASVSFISSPTNITINHIFRIGLKTKNTLNHIVVKMRFSIEDCFKKLTLPYEEYGVKLAKTKKTCHACQQPINEGEYYAYYKKYVVYRAYHPKCFELTFLGSEVKDLGYGKVICVNQKWKKKYIFKRKTRGKKGSKHLSQSHQET